MVVADIKMHMTIKRDKLVLQMIYLLSVHFLYLNYSSISSLRDFFYSACCGYELLEVPVDLVAYF